MATIHAFMVRHAPGCAGMVGRGECSDGCEWEQFAVVADFYPRPGMSLRERIMLARMAAMFKARGMVNGGPRRS